MAHKYPLHLQPDKSYLYRGIHIKRGGAGFVCYLEVKGAEHTFTERKMQDMKACVDIALAASSLASAVTEAPVLEKETPQYGDNPPTSFFQKDLWLRREFKRIAEKYRLKGWTLSLNKGRRQAGCCHYFKKLITVSRFHLDKSDLIEVFNTLLHEIAHAIAGRDAGHGPEWKSIARSIGCSGDRCHTLTFSEAKYTLSCANGCWTSDRHRRMRNVQYRKCSTCKGKLVEKKNF